MPSQFEYIRIDLKRLLPDEEEVVRDELAKALKDKEGITTSGRLAMRWHEASFKENVKELIHEIKSETTKQSDKIKKQIATSLAASSGGKARPEDLLSKISFLSIEQARKWDKLCKEASTEDVSFFNKYEDEIYDDDDEAVGEILEQEALRCCDQLGLDEPFENFMWDIWELQPDFFKARVASLVRGYWLAINSDNLA